MAGAPAVNPYGPQAAQFYGMLQHNNPLNPNPVQIPAATQAGYDQETAAANQGYNASIAQNALQRSQAGQQYAQLLRGFNMKEDLARQQMPFASNANGMLGSGVWRQALSQYAQNRLQQLGTMNLRNSQRLAGYDAQRQQLIAQHAAALAGIQATRGQLIAQLAMQNIPQVSAP